MRETCSQATVDQLNIIERLQLCLQPFYKLLSSIAGVSIFLIMVITSLDVLGRYFLSRPLEGSMELCEFLMLFVGFPAFICLQSKNSHLNVDLLYQKFSDGGKAASRVFQMAASAPFIFILAWQLLITAFDKLEYGDSTDVLSIPVGPFYFFVAICLVVLGVTMILTLLNDWLYARKYNAQGKAFIALFLAILMSCATYWACGKPLGIETEHFGGIILLVLFILILTGMPIGYAMCTAGIQGLLLMMDSPDMAYGLAACAPYPQVASFNMTVIPMFVLLGELALFGNVSKGLFDTAARWMGHLPGGLAIASVCGCAGFAAVCGDSIATAMTMATVSLPEMKEKGYDESFGAACLSVGGTLGILIPPSMGFIMYAIVTEESVAKLFMSGIVPGIMLTAILTGIIYMRARIDPALAPRGPRSTWKEKFSSLYKMLPMIGLFTLIMGGILTGFCTPTEGGAIGALGCLIFCIFTRMVTVKKIVHACQVSSDLCGKLFLILIGVGIMGYVLAASNLPTALANWISVSGISPYPLLGVILLAYILLGMLMNVIPMIMLILPAIFPSVIAAGFDPIWFGVITVLMMELGQITPPVGVLVFAMSGVVPHVPMVSIFKHVSIFFLGILLCVLLLILFPSLCLFLPSFL